MKFKILFFFFVIAASHEKSHWDSLQKDFRSRWGRMHATDQRSLLWQIFIARQGGLPYLNHVAARATQFQAFQRR